GGRRARGGGGRSRTVLVRGRRGRRRGDPVRSPQAARPRARAASVGRRRRPGARRVHLDVGPLRRPVHRGVSAVTASMPPPDGDLDRLWAVADEAGARGAEIVFGAASTARFGRDAEAKGVGDWVTGTDRASEDAVRGYLERATPDVPVLGEEEGGERGERFWAVDPLDGTTNFVIGFPVVAVSVADRKS